MTHAELDTIFKTYGAKAGKDGWLAFPEGSVVSIHVAREGASLTLARVDGVKFDGEVLFGRTPKKELYAARTADVLAVSYDPGSSQPARRAGF